MLRLYVIGLTVMLGAAAVAADPLPPPRISLLIVDGMNNHDWPRATRILKEILEGKHDDLPEQAFYMAGTIDDVLAQAEKMKADSEMKQSKEEPSSESVG